jgi:hypothetical protein
MLHRTTMTSTRSLMAAVLRAAVEDCTGARGELAGPYRRAVRPQDARLALAYVMSTDRTWPFSFENLCEALGIDADALRLELVGRDEPRAASGSR